MPPLKPLLILPALLLSARAARAQTTVTLAEPKEGDSCQNYSIQVEFSSLFGQHDYPLVTEVGEGSPAALAGMKPGDMIVSRNGRDTMKPDTVRVTRPAPGDTVRFVVRRDGKDVPLVMVAGELRRDAAGHLVCTPHAATR